MDNTNEIPVTNVTTIEDFDAMAKLQKKKNQIRKALKEKGILPKGAHNDYDNYDYFSEAQYKELFTELFSEYGVELYVTEDEYKSFDGSDKQPFGRIVTLACTLIDIDTGYGETSRHTGEGLDRGDKAGYKATTGALKKFLSSTFLVATKDDPERDDDYTSKKKNVTKTVPKQKELGTITNGQMAIIKTLFKESKDELLNMMVPYKKKKIEELNIDEASKIISAKKGESNEQFSNNKK